jgi:hypothetical protein
MFILKLVVDTKSAPRLEGKRKQKKNGDKAVRFPYTGFIYRVICGTRSVRRSDKVMKN